MPSYNNNLQKYNGASNADTLISINALWVVQPRWIFFFLFFSFIVTKVIILILLFFFVKCMCSLSLVFLEEVDDNVNVSNTRIWCWSSTMWAWSIWRDMFVLSWILNFIFVWENLVHKVTFAVNTCIDISIGKRCYTFKARICSLWSPVYYRALFFKSNTVADLSKLQLQFNESEKERDNYQLSLYNLALQSFLQSTFHGFTVHVVEQVNKSFTATA